MKTPAFAKVRIIASFTVMCLAIAGYWLFGGPASSQSRSSVVPPQYTIYDIGVVQVGDTASQGFGVSPNGIAVGRSFRPSNGGAQAFSWTVGGGLVGLPNLAGRNFAVSNGANDNGIVVGTAATTSFGSGRLPIPVEAFEAAIRADGKAVESNLKGFRAGLAAARDQLPVAIRRSDKRPAKPTLAGLEAEASALPEAARAIATEGVRRLVAYQDPGYARLYLDRLKPVGEHGKLLVETARHLAVRMSFEDVIRVAEAKIAPERFRRIEGEINAKDQPYVITEFLKPGIEELCQALPPRLARAIVAYAEKRGWLGTVYFAMELKTTTVWGYLRFWGLAKLKRFRPKGWRFAEEQVAIEAWLARVVAAAKVSPDLALEIAECARLIKGYGDTWKRGSSNYATIEARVIAPVLEGRIPLRAGIDAIASARTAALIDPEGESLAKALAAIDAQVALPMAAE